MQPHVVPRLVTASLMKSNQISVNPAVDTPVACAPCIHTHAHARTRIRVHTHFIFSWNGSSRCGSPMCTTKASKNEGCAHAQRHALQGYLDACVEGFASVSGGVRYAECRSSWKLETYNEIGYGYSVPNVKAGFGDSSVTSFRIRPKSFRSVLFYRGGVCAASRASA